MSHIGTTALGLAVATVLGACGSSAPQPPPSAGPAAPGAPALLQRQREPREIVLAAEASPRRHGPIRFNGRYTVALAQYAPEAPGRGFADAVPFVAELRPASDPRARPVSLFHTAARAGARSLTLHGSYAVEVLFGDFPYVIRFSPTTDER